MKINMQNLAITKILHMNVSEKWPSHTNNCSELTDIDTSPHQLLYWIRVFSEYRLGPRQGYKCFNYKVSE